MQLGDKKLVVQLASAQKGKEGGPLAIGYNQPQISGIDLSRGAGQPTEVLCLMNMITEDDLREDEEYEGKSIWVL